MRIIQKLSDMIGEEIGDARKYAKCALEYRESDPELSRAFSALSNEELGHMSRLHDQVVRLIKQYRDVHGEPPVSMQAVYDYLHRKNIEAVSEVRALLSS